MIMGITMNFMSTMVARGVVDDSCRDRGARRHAHGVNRGRPRPRSQGRGRDRVLATTMAIVAPPGPRPWNCFKAFGFTVLSVPTAVARRPPPSLLLMLPWRYSPRGAGKGRIPTSRSSTGADEKAATACKPGTRIGALLVLPTSFAGDGGAMGSGATGLERRRQALLGSRWLWARSFTGTAGAELDSALNARLHGAGVTLLARSARCQCHSVENDDFARVKLGAGHDPETDQS